VTILPANDCQMNEDAAIKAVAETGTPIVMLCCTSDCRGSVYANPWEHIQLVLHCFNVVVDLLLYLYVTSLITSVLRYSLIFFVGYCKCRQTQMNVSVLDLVRRTAIVGGHTRLNR